MVATKRNANNALSVITTSDGAQQRTPTGKDEGINSCRCVTTLWEGMKMGIQITCVDKPAVTLDDPHVAISRLGWTNDVTKVTGSSTREQMWRFVTDNPRQAYVSDSLGVAYLIAKTNARGTRYVQTERDNRPTDNLLKLPRCG